MTGLFQWYDIGTRRALLFCLDAASSGRSKKWVRNRAAIWFTENEHAKKSGESLTAAVKGCGCKTVRVGCVKEI